MVVIETRKNLTRGFTLLELLLVTFIIALVSGIAVLSISDQRESGLNNEGEKLLATMRWLADRAVLQQQPSGLNIVQQGYQLLIWNQGTRRWEILSAHSFPDYIEIHPAPVRQPPPPDQELDQEQLATDRPQPPIVADIIFYPDQQIESHQIELTIKGSDQSVRLIIEPQREAYIVEQ